MPIAWVFLLLFAFAGAGLAQPASTTPRTYNGNATRAGATAHIDHAPTAYGAAGDCAADDGAALVSAAMAATAAGGALYIDRCYVVASERVLTASVIFAAGGVLKPATGVTVTIAGEIAAPSGAHIFNGAGKVAAATASFVSVAWWGALVASDPAPAFRAAIGSNREVYVPPASYTFKSLTPVAPLPALFDAAVLVRDLEMIDIRAFGATFTVDDAHALSELFVFDGVRGGSFWGGAFVGNRTGVEPTAENVGVCYVNTVNFDDGHHVFKGWGGHGAAYCGDFIVNMRIHDIDMDGVGMCHDLGFQRDVTIENVTARGIGNDNLTGVGYKCYSSIYDAQYVGFNTTGYDMRETSGVTLRNFHARNFAVGGAIASGKGYKIADSDFSDMPGIAPSAAGMGLYFYYINGGSFDSTGHPVGDVLITDTTFARNGSTTPGAGVYVDASQIGNGDVLEKIIIGDGAVFDNNEPSGVRCNGAALSNAPSISVGAVFKGAAQTMNVATCAIRSGETRDAVPSRGR